MAESSELDRLLLAVMRRYPGMKLGDIADILLQPDNPKAHLFTGMSHEDVVFRLGRVIFNASP